MDYLAVASLFGSPVGYVLIGFALYKVYSRILTTERYAKRANHNTDAIIKILLSRGMVTEDELKGIQFGNGSQV